MSIKHLPQDVIDKLKSSVTITSLNQVVIGLVKNSLDAGSSRINIHVDCSRGNCTVEDDGTGILPGDFHRDGGLGKLHNTSRQSSSPSGYGKHGVFLASLANLSLLSITSHHQRHVSQNSILFRNGQVLSRALPCMPEHRFETYQHGTRVIVRDLFGAMPVRVKQRAVMAADRTYLDRDWSQLVRQVLSLLLAWPSETVVMLKDMTTQREARLRSAVGRDVIPRTMQLLAQAELAWVDDSDLWTPVSATSGGVGVKGCICSEPSASKSYQFLSLGIYPVDNQYGSNPLYDEVNKVFGNSSFGNIEDEGVVSGNDNLPTSKLRVRKGLERWPVYNLQIQLPGPDRHVDADGLENDRSGEVSAILDLLRAVCYGFLKKHHMRPHKVPIAADESGFSTQTKLASRKPPKRRNSPRSAEPRSEQTTSHSIDAGKRSPFEDWQRVKVGHATANKLPSRSHTNHQAKPLIREGGKLLRKPFGSEEDEAETISAATPGTALPNTTNLGTESPVKPANATSVISDGSRRRPLEKRPRPEPSPWLQNILQSYENPVFGVTQPLIRQACSETAADTRHVSALTGPSEGTYPDVSFETGVSGLSGSITRDALAGASVIAQVDRKFILVKLPLSQNTGQEMKSALIMIDQHASDERIKLEELMSHYFDVSPSGDLTPVTETLLEPIKVEVSAKEGELLSQQRAYFASWGVIYSTSPATKATRGKEAAAVVKVTALPLSILERCRTETRLLIDLLRKEVWTLHEEGKTPHRPSLPSSPGGGGGNSWVARFHGCPRGILDLLHSRSCRSAIMFNDVLTREECAKLVTGLAECAFPFQCAHGRPSMVPLFNMGSGPRIGGWSGDQQGVDPARWTRYLHDASD